MKKVLMLASVASMIDQFNMPNILILLDMGYEVHVACNFEKGNTCSFGRIQELQVKLQLLNVSYHQIDFARNIIEINKNIKAYHQVLNLLTNYKYDFIHCHSPIGGLCGRIVAHVTRTKVIYTVHGFHFFKGAPIKNWLLYYPVERWLARYTDVLITINKEDYNYAVHKMLSIKRVEYVPGVGIDIDKISNISIDKQQMKAKLGIKNECVLISIGELNFNKNHETIIKAISAIDSPIKYIICGIGKNLDYLRSLTKKLKVENKVIFLGFREDVYELLNISDIFCFPSYREGLSVALMEAMASGLPVVCSKIRGNVDLIENNQGGYLLDPKDDKGFTVRIKELIENKNLRYKMGLFNKQKIKEYGKSNVDLCLQKIYKDCEMK